MGFALHGQQSGLTLTSQTVRLVLDTQIGDEVVVVLIESGEEEVFFSAVAESTVTLVRGVPAPTSARTIEARVNGTQVLPRIESESIVLDWPAEEGDGFEVLASRDGEFWMSRETVVAEGTSVSLSLDSSGDESEFFAVRSGLPEFEPDPGGSLEGWVVQRGESLELASPERRQEGDKPAVGAIVRVQGRTIETDADGQFLVEGLEAVQSSVRFEFSGLQRVDEILIVPNRTTSLGRASLARQDAYELFLKQAQSAGWLGADGQSVYLMKNSQIVGTSHPLPAETPVTSVDVLERQPTFNQILFDEPAWLFHLDPFSNQAYGHPGLIGLVGDVTGQVEIKEFFYWPVIDGVSYWSSLGEQMRQGLLLEPVEASPLYVTPNDPQLLSTNGDKSGGVDDSVQLKDHPKPPCPTGKTYAVFFQGGTERTFGVSAEKFKAHIKPSASKIIRPDVDVLGRGRVKQKIGAVYARIVQRLFPLMKPCDTLVVYVAGHGIVDSRGKPGGGVIFVDKQTDNLSAIDILQPLRKLPACHLLVVVDSCFSGSMVSKKGGFFPFESLADQFLPDYVQALFVSSTDVKTAAQFRKVSFSFAPLSFSFVADETRAGGLFTLELIAAGLGTKPISLNAFNKGVASLVGQKGTAAQAQGATTFLLPAKLDCQLGVPPKVGGAETEPNDGEGTANELEDASDGGGEKTASGSLGLEGEDTDVWKAEFTAGDYRFEDLGGDYQVEVKIGDAVVEGAAPEFEFEVPDSGEVFIRVFGGTSENYEFAVRPIETQTEFVVRNDTDSLVTFEIGSEGGETLADVAITLQPGEIFERKLESTVESLSVLNLHDSTADRLELDAPVSELTLGEGDRGMMLIQPTGIQAWLEPIGTIPFSGLE